MDEQGVEFRPFVGIQVIGEQPVLPIDHNGILMVFGQILGAKRAYRIFFNLLDHLAIDAIGTLPGIIKVNKVAHKNNYTGVGISIFGCGS